MNQMKKPAMSWQTIIMLLLVPVLFYSCTVSRPVIETGVEPVSKPGVEPGMEPSAGSGAETVVKPSVQPVPEPKPEALSDLCVIGEVEPVTLIKSGLTLPARIDTGATTSSLDATEIKYFERDGKDWVRFMVTDRRNGEKKQMECRLSRTVKIKRHGEEPLRRPVVKVRAMMGGVELVREFSITDRSEFKYQVLIGRNFLEGEFVVDVNRKNVTTPMSEK